MERYPVSVLDFQDLFPTDEACYNYLCLMKWPEGFVCPKCQHRDAWKMKKGAFRCKQCRSDTRVTAGTIFDKTRTQLRMWFNAIWYIVNQKNGVSALGLQKVLGLKSYETTWTWLHKLRTAMVRPGRDRLHGLVEVDETLVGGPQPGKRGRGASGKVLVLVAVEDREGTRQKGIGRIRLRIIPDASVHTLEDAIEKMVKPGSTIRTDGWTGYNGLEAKGYNHVVAKHYLDEYTFRFNRRRARSRGKLFYELIRQALLVDPAPLKLLKA